MTLTKEELEIWWQNEVRKIKPLPSWYFESGTPPFIPQKCDKCDSKEHLIKLGYFLLCEQCHADLRLEDTK
jgi:hypothetical protein